MHGLYGTARHSPCLVEEPGWTFCAGHPAWFVYAGIIVLSPPAALCCPGKVGLGSAAEALKKWRFGMT
jgi:hypothetical protein